ncbi:MAG: hypothetical protein CMO30_27810 [Tistrella sp.]|jgi:uncharacterized membrane protein|uniref:Transmembrane protein n=1 Tax=Tistrella mobilis TaxID=171437 RepID=A0A162LXY0_9PROT|nr:MULTISPECIES: hypothetical protein [Tistrella]KYO57528.1 hypothetical protein AUP44_19725 [Tistrella mobilis]MAD38489.1 hypothetical protein [Tistrella sp.]MBA79080.1 hypothetical protein [Tistrella sp.]HAE51527.1 hypothetical protein [Tistrella mobilis]|tara:strand:+ start:559 stop:927 length:369 start_codon:yes stop_codon:yes gene_type:complete
MVQSTPKFELRPGADDRTAHQAEVMLTVTYGLHLLGMLTALPLVVASIIAHVRFFMLDTETTERAHYRYLVETFWFGVIANVIGAALTVIFIGFVVLGITWIWMVWRFVRGWLRMRDGQRPR